MSVLIKGMKMPTSCTMCWLSPICPVWVKEVSRHKGYDYRLPDCPLVEVPTPHGRLIDADALEDKLNGLFRTRDYDTIDFYNHAIADCIATVKNVPTIIEAEEGSHAED